MSDRVYTLSEIKAIAAPVAREYGVAALYLFGSYARGEANAQSDLDFRVEKGRVRSLLELGGLRCELEERFDKELDLLTTQMFSPEFLKAIRPEEVLIYDGN